MNNALRQSHYYLKQLIDRFPEGLYIDGTIGNGHDAYFMLSQPSFNGQLIGFDVQEQAIINSKEKLNNLSTNNYQLIQDSHANLRQYTEDKAIQGAIFNFGYLPGGDHSITTTVNSSQLAIQSVIETLALHGQCILVFYPGHLEGQKERDILLNYLTTLPQQAFQVLSYQLINQINNPPHLVVIERIK